MQSKTYKREVAGVLLLFLMALAGCAVSHPGALEVLRLLSPPIFLFAAGAFGIDAYAKQVKGA